MHSWYFLSRISWLGCRRRWRARITFVWVVSRRVVPSSVVAIRIPRVPSIAIASSIVAIRVPSVVVRSAPIIVSIVSIIVRTTAAIVVAVVSSIVVSTLVSSIIVSIIRSLIASIAVIPTIITTVISIRSTVTVRIRISPRRSFPAFAFSHRATNRPPEHLHILHRRHRRFRILPSLVSHEPKPSRPPRPVFSRHIHVPNRPKLRERLPQVIQRHRIVEIVNLDARQVRHIRRGFARTSVVAWGVARPPCVDVDVAVAVAVHPIVVHALRSRMPPRRRHPSTHPSSSIVVVRAHRPSK